MSRPWILSFIFFLFGGGVGLLVGLSLGNEPVTPDRTVASPRPTHVPSPPPRRPVESTAPAPAPKRVVKQVPARPSSERLDAIARGVEIPRYEGRGTITGRVRTSDGRPVEAAVVRATAVTSPSSRGRSDVAPPERDLETVVREAVERYHRDAQSRREATTDVEGRFTLTGIGDSTYTVRAYARGYRILGGKDARRARAGASLTFFAKPVVWLPISVVSRGEAVTSAQVSILRGRGGRTIYPWSPDSAALELEPGRTHRLQATTEDGRESEIASVTLIAGAEPEPLVLTLRSVPGIAGRVLVEREDSRSTSVHVWLLKQEGALPDGATLAAKRDEAQTVSWFRGFRFCFNNLQPGVYALGVGRRDRCADHVESVTVADRQVVRDIRLPPLDPRDYVQVRVYGPDGTPVTEASFSLTVRSGHNQSGRGLQPMRRSDGSFWIPLPGSSDRNKKNARFFVRVRSDVHGTKEVEFTPGRDSEVIIRYSASATLVVTVGGLDRIGKSRVQLSLRRTSSLENRSGIPPLSGKTPDARGIVRLGPVQTGHYTLAGSTGRLGDRVEVLRMELELQPGENRTSVVIPPLHSLTVIARGCPRMQLESTDPRGRIRQFKSIGDDHRVVFDGLPAGQYVLNGYPGGQMNVRVPAPGPVRFEPRPVNALRVEVTDPAGAFAKAGFQTGDLIVGVGGKLFKDLVDMQAQMIRLTAKGESPMMVERAGRRLVIRFDLGLMRKGNAGGRMNQTAR